MFYSKRENGNIVSTDIRGIINERYKNHIDADRNTSEQKNAFQQNILSIIDNINTSYCYFERDYFSGNYDGKTHDTYPETNIIGHILIDIFEDVWEQTENEVQQGYLNKPTMDKIWNAVLDVMENTRCDSHCDIYYQLLSRYLPLRRQGIKLK